MIDLPALRPQFLDAPDSALMKFTLLTRDRADYLVDRYSERKADGRVTAGDEFCAVAMHHERKAG